MFKDLLVQQYLDKQAQQCVFCIKLKVKYHYLTKLMIIMYLEVHYHFVLLHYFQIGFILEGKSICHYMLLY